MSLIRVGISAFVIALLLAGSAGAASLSPIGAFERPMGVASAPTEPDRLFVAERDGTIREIGRGAPFAELDPLVAFDQSGQEGGLLSIAFAPAFALTGRLYVAYTDADNEIVVAELRAGPNGAPLSSLRPLLEIPHPGETNHYGGQLRFGPDGMLYVATGDGGGADDEHGNAQDPASPLGKILRLGPEPSGLLPYTVPADNPYAGGPTGDDLVWSLGLRNPYRFSFDPVTGAMLIGDVGQGAEEEIDRLGPGEGGVNFGWPCREGTLPGPAAGEAGCLGAGPFAEPLFAYGHSGPGFAGCAVIGGGLVRDAGVPELAGRYLYADYCDGRLRSFDPAFPAATDRDEGLGAIRPTSIDADSCGRIYVSSATGIVWRLRGGGTPTCEPSPVRRASTFVGIRAQKRKVLKRKRAQITVWVSPCTGRRGTPVTLMRGQSRLATKRLDRACTARFRPRIARRTKFRAVVGEDAAHLGAVSRKLQVLAVPRGRAGRRG